MCIFFYALFLINLKESNEHLERNKVNIYILRTKRSLLPGRILSPDSSLELLSDARSTVGASFDLRLICSATCTFWTFPHFAQDPLSNSYMPDDEVVWFEGGFSKINFFATELESVLFAQLCNYIGMFPLPSRVFALISPTLSSYCCDKQRKLNVNVDL
jgi:hypothetical protein